MARHLGPATYGDLSFAIATVALLGPLATVGLHGVVVRQLVVHPDQSNAILGSAALMRLGGSTLTVIAVFAGTGLVGGGPRLPLLQIVVLGVLFQAFEVIDLFLQAEGRMKASATARSLAAALTSAARVVLILSAAGVAAFAWTFTVELALWAGVLLVVYQARTGSLMSWRWSSYQARRLLGSSWPLILSGIGAALNLKIDQVMLGAMVEAEELGVYSAAARLSEAVYFVPHVFIAAALPGIVRAHTLDQASYWRQLQKLSQMMVGLALLAILGGLIVGPFLIDALLGESFARSIPVFRVHLLGCLFIFPGALLSRWLITEDLTRFSITRHSSGAVVNVALNLLLIPLYGGLGSAIATVISYATASHFAFYFSARTRPAARLVTRALLWIPWSDEERSS